MASVRVLCLHGVGDHAPDPYWLSQQRLCETLDAATACAPVELTFDDGNLSDFEVVLPELRRRGLVATFFVTVSKVGTPGFVSWSQLCELREEGMRIGNHGMTHASWRRCTVRELDVELVAARTELEQQLGEPIEFAACPYGDYDRRVLARARKAGYAAFYTTDGGVTPEAAWLRHRTCVSTANAGPRLRRAVSSPSSRVTAHVKTAWRSRRRAPVSG